MNCQLCKKELDSYIEGKLSDDLKNQIEAHLLICSDCKDAYRLQILADRVMAAEKELEVNPFLATRVMAEIETRESGTVRSIPNVLRPVLITISMGTAVFLGVIMGSIPQYKKIRETIPVELALIDDTRIESIDLLSNE
ncbi:MAG TPA: hypothetical protein DDW27_12950 [Bacteroidales bacterium]|nr:hypothetical protein [Bacteroidales bacterium]